MYCGTGRLGALSSEVLPVGMPSVEAPCVEAPSIEQLAAAVLSCGAPLVGVPNNGGHWGCCDDGALGVLR